MYKLSLFGFCIIGMLSVQVSWGFLALDPGALTYLTSKVSPNSSSTFYGQQISFGTDKLVIGQPKASGDGNSTDDGDVQRATGRISICDYASLLNTNKSSCTDVTPPQAKPGDSFGLSLSYSEYMTACSATRTQECKNANHNQGFCYRSTDSGRSWTADPQSSLTGCSNNLDIMFVLDGSGSIGDDFVVVKNWTMDMASFFDIESGYDQIGVVQYSYHSKKKSQISTEVVLGECKTRACFNNKVSQIDLLGSQTFTAHALNKTVEDFKGSWRYGKSGTSQIMILLTDGRSTDNHLIQSSADYVRSMGITTFAVGVGQDIDQNELKVIANGGNSTSRVYNVSDFGQLQAIVTELRGEIFKVALEGGSATSSTSVYNLKLGETGFSISESKKVQLRDVGSFGTNGSECDHLLPAYSYYKLSVNVLTVKMR